MPKKIRKTEEQWKEALAPEQYQVLRQGHTERPFTGRYNDFWEKGLYVCAGCGTPLFPSESKYDHDTGWPSFTAPVAEKNIAYKDDFSLLIKRVEVRCAACGAHLGHVFDDGPAPTFLHYCINSAAMNFLPSEETKEEPPGEASGPVRPGPAGKDKSGPAGMDVARPETATFAAGCFWGVEDKLGKVPGVLSTVVGYTGGKTASPSYEDVCTGKTGHAEAVQLTYDPAEVSYEQLLGQFFSIHDPTQVNRQDPDRGSQYRSAIFYHDQKQKEAAEKAMAELRASKRFKAPLATELVAAGVFNRAEDYHQKYFEKHGIACH
ncbi:MAG: bifunctional methionine sulfoxide reductase B/A protein [Candidatus Aminicenantales bacterium]